MVLNLRKELKIINQELSALKASEDFYQKFDRHDLKKLKELMKRWSRELFDQTSMSMNLQQYQTVRRFGLEPDALNSDEQEKLGEDFYKRADLRLDLESVLSLQNDLKLWSTTLSSLGLINLTGFNGPLSSNPGEHSLLSLACSCGLSDWVSDSLSVHQEMDLHQMVKFTYSPAKSLMMCVIAGNWNDGVEPAIKTLNVLRSKGLNIDQRDSRGGHALHFAITQAGRSGDYGKITEWVLAHATSIDLQDPMPSGYAPLAYVVIHQKYALVDLLIEAGVDSNAPLRGENQGELAMDIAKRMENLEMVKHLDRHMKIQMEKKELTAILLDHQRPSSQLGKEDKYNRTLEGVASSLSKPTKSPSKRI